MNKEYILVSLKTNKQVKVGDKVTDFRGESGILTDVTPHTGANGHIYMDGNRYYPSVIGCKFVEKPLYVIVRHREEAEDYNTVEVLQRRLFHDEDKAKQWCKELKSEAVKWAKTVTGEDPKTISFEVVPLTPE